MPFHTATGGTRLFHLDAGDGPPVLLVHGRSLSSAVWEYQVRTLAAAGYRCVAMDRRGHGRSDAPGRSAPNLTGRPTAKLLRNGRFRLVEGAPHGLYVTARATVDEELLAFARSSR